MKKYYILVFVINFFYMHSSENIFDLDSKIVEIAEEFKYIQSQYNFYNECINNFPNAKLILTNSLTQQFAFLKEEYEFVKRFPINQAQKDQLLGLVENIFYISRIENDTSLSIYIAAFFKYNNYEAEMYDNFFKNLMQDIKEIVAIMIQEIVRLRLKNYKNKPLKELGIEVLQLFNKIDYLTPVR